MGTTNRWYSRWSTAVETDEPKVPAHRTRNQRADLMRAESRSVWPHGGTGNQEVNRSAQTLDRETRPDFERGSEISSVPIT